MRGPARPRVKAAVRVIDAADPATERAIGPVRDSVDLLHAHVGDNGVEHHALFASTRAGFAPATAGNSTAYLRGDATWRAPSVTVEYIATGGEDDFVVSVDRALPYVVLPSGAGMVSFNRFDCPVADRTATSFRVLTANPLSPGDRLEFLVV